MSREADAALAVLQVLAAETKGLPGADAAVGFIGKTFRRRGQRARGAAGGGKTRAARRSAALNKVAPHQAELFATTRLAADHGAMYGAVDLADDDVRALLARALP